ncbi:MAG: acylphosphatase [Oribacterium sp.]|nr:acylphosphatase [Oribacterium sp.]
MSESIVRKHIYFSGDVQGVGFRFRSYYIAQSLGLTGWVENMWDGRVEMEVQGSESAIQELLARIRQQRWIDITDLEMSEIPCVEESEFHIR